MLFEVSEFEFNSALKKFKNWVYQERTNLFLRKKLSEYLNSDDVLDYEEFLEKDNEFWMEKISQIDYKVILKGVNLQHENENNRFDLSNVIENRNFTLEKYNLFIDCPIEIHILSTIWLIKFGPLLDDQLLPSCFGNRLELNSKTKQLKPNSTRSYKLYFDQFRKWRDNCITISREYLRNSGDSLSIINMDIKRFYYNVNLNFELIQEEFKTEYILNQDLFDFMVMIHKKYAEVTNNEKIVIPLGLISSGVLANWYLKSFDDDIRKKIRPLYYGRYVDDILLVLPNPIIKNLLHPKEDIFAYLKKQKVIKGSFKSKNKTFSIEIENKVNGKTIKDTLELQTQKMLVHYFSSKSPLVLLDKFFDQIKRQSSEYKFLPEEKDLERSFVDEAYSIIYGNSNFVYREIKDLKENKNGVASFLRKILTMALFSKSNDKFILKSVDEILGFFDGYVFFDFYSFWERVSTFFVIAKNKKALKRFIFRSLELVENVRVEIDKDLLTKVEKAKVRNDLKDYFEISTGASLSLYPNFFSENINEYLTQNQEFKNIYNNAVLFREVNFSRHYYVYWPLMNYIPSVVSNHNVDYSSFKLDWVATLNESDFDLKVSDNDVRFIHFYEFLFISFLKNLYVDNDSDIETSYLINYAKKYFYNIYPYLKISYDNGIKVDKIDPFDLIGVASSSESSKLKIGIVSMKMSTNGSIDELLGSNTDFLKSYKDLSALMNNAQKTKCDMVGFPEASVPFQFLPLFLKESAFNNRAFTFGLKHFAINGKVYNLICSCLPVELGSFKSSVLVVRPKNYGAPKEILNIEGEIDRESFGSKPYKFYEPSTVRYNLVLWRSLTMTFFNCFELCDITSRSHFKSIIDLLIAVEFNSDIKYFSNIVESTSRDLHCYLGQINNAEFGDSRLTMPSKSETKDLIQIKGGENTYLVVETVDFGKLKNFQLKTHAKQLQDKSFKPTPPGFDTDFVKVRGNFDETIKLLRSKKK